ncbi:GNAT family N-acetyltransferase [Actinomycetospora sp. TBRC 11914]|uniref:GNAT family N-acetyltransferase n=1 Tax=Actinomycetospora sp. TBRC 11914 TaxID=2729387 RepID=UPI00145DAC99|nr:GNAT family N-acetyltransferase [Actinomycetospora sp. TBRC 11914]NMO88804.1 N-acetyltransferase [Actinomycetospora sp. TBRC 11914]
MPTIRDATPADAAACAAIYAPYVTDTVISFEAVAPDADAMAARIAAAHVWLVAEDGGRPVGFAYGGEFNPREAYRWSCSVSVYLEPGRRRTGAGRALYEALFARLADLGYRRAAAGITLPNDASVGLHTAMGFEPVGTFPRIGRKFDAWHDVAWMQRDLG